MASTSTNRFNNAVTTLVSENQALIAEIRKSIGLIKGVALDLEKDHQTEKVKELDDAVLELLETYVDCQHYCEAIQSVGNSYQASDQLTDFKKLLEEHASKAKVASGAVTNRNPLYRQFKEAVWNVHHEGQPMPGEEQEDIVMTSTQNILLNVTCPLTGKPVVELQDPVRCMDCKHIYEKDPIMHYIRSKKTQSKCPVAGCPRVLQAARVVCDPLLLIEINEMRTSEKTHATNVQDFTEIDDDD